MRKTILLALAIGAGWILISQAPVGSTSGGLIPAPQVGFLAPDFELPTSSGETVRLSDLPGQAVLVNLWASWCPPCIRELPMLIRLQEAFDPSQVQVVGIAIDRLEAVEQVIEDHPVNFPILIGDVEAVELSRRLGNRLQGLPFTVIFDHHGRRAFSQVGEVTQATLDTQLQALLPKTQPPKTAANGG